MPREEPRKTNCHANIPISPDFDFKIPPSSLRRFCPATLWLKHFQQHLKTPQTLCKTPLDSVQNALDCFNQLLAVIQMTRSRYQVTIDVPWLYVYSIIDSCAKHKLGLPTIHAPWLYIYSQLLCSTVHRGDRPLTVIHVTISCCPVPRLWQGSSTSSRLLAKSLYRDRNTLQHTATHCNTLQHTATHCNMLCTGVYY